MKPIEAYADRKRCEFCGADVVDGEADGKHERTEIEVLRRLAFLADSCPSLALILIQKIAGRSDLEVAKKFGISRQAVRQRIVRAENKMFTLCSE